MFGRRVKKHKYGFRTADLTQWTITDWIQWQQRLLYSFFFAEADRNLKPFSWRWMTLSSSCEPFHFTRSVYDSSNHLNHHVTLDVCLDQINKMWPVNFGAFGVLIMRIYHLRGRTRPAVYVWFQSICKAKLTGCAQLKRLYVNQKPSGAFICIFWSPSVNLVVYHACPHQKADRRGWKWKQPLTTHIYVWLQ